MGDAPGTLTFLFTDIEGSTRLWESAPDAMRTALERHDTIVQEAVAAHDGRIFATGGDGFAAVFTSAVDAVSAAVSMQAALTDEPWPPAAPLKVRMAVHSGESVEREGDFFGPVVNRAARLMAIGHGGQILCSSVTAGLLGGAVPLVDLGVHRLRDLLASQRVYQVGTGSFPPVQSLDSVPSNLPTALSDLIGRSSEVADVVATLHDHRLVTLTGVGGVGKTRLGLAAAAETRDFPDGRWLVELAAVSSGSDVVGAVAAAMQVPLHMASSLDQLIAYLSQRRLLIVLDNCEHLLDDVADVVERILQGAPEVAVIATSREPLGVHGEITRRVRSLAVPADDVDVVSAREWPAVELFVERANGVSDAFRLDAANVAAVVDICRHLDGIPLAIELAAARVGGMAPADIARRLDDRFRLLTGGGRRSRERHRTLFATVSWSYDLLDEPDRLVFARLGVFPATFDLAAAEAVAADAMLTAFDITDILVRLVSRSLVVHDPESGRYWMLETLRQFGMDRLGELDDIAATRERYAAHYLAAARELGPQLQDARFGMAYAQVESDLDNFRALAEWFMTEDRWSDLSALARSLAVFLNTTSPAEGFAWCRRAAEQPGIASQEAVDLLGQAAMAAWSTGERDPVLAMAAESDRLSETSGAAPSPSGRCARAAALVFSGHFDDALRAIDAACSAAAARNDAFAAAQIDSWRIAALAGLQRWAECEEATRLAFEAASHLGHPFLVAGVVASAGSARVFYADEPQFEAGLAIYDAYEVASPDPMMNAWIRCARGFTLLGAGRPEAMAELGEALRAADRMGNLAAVVLTLETLAWGYAGAGNVADAARLHAYAAANAAYAVETPGWQWVRRRLDDVLASLDADERERLQQDGSRLTRRQVLAIVERNERLHDGHPSAVPAPRAGS